VKLTFSPAARADLLDIAEFIAQRNQARAVTFVDELESKCAALARAPGVGTSRRDLGDGMRVLPHGRYLLFYRAGSRSLRIERILHGARDIDGDDFDAAITHVN
jgi:toxin ParE1/3/4